MVGQTLTGHVKKKSHHHIVTDKRGYAYVMKLEMKTALRHNSADYRTSKPHIINPLY